MRTSLFKLAVMACLISGLGGCVGPIALGLINSAKEEKQKRDSGADIRIAFRNQNGVEAPVEPLPAATKVAVWPGDESEVRFAQKISARFTVTTPGVVTAVLASNKVNPSLKGLAPAELNTGFSVVCAKIGTDLVFASRQASALRYDLFAFGCKQKRMVWSDGLEIVAPNGISKEALPRVIDMAENAWANRILDASQLGSTQARK